MTLLRRPASVVSVSLTRCCSASVVSLRRQARRASSRAALTRSVTGAPSLMIKSASFSHDPSFRQLARNLPMRASEV